MIIARSPLRITLGGGGTDLPEYFEREGGMVLAAAIDKYVYITLHETFVPELIVKYSRLERVADAAELEHPIVREALASLGMNGHSLEIASHADIPAGTGLGSSSSFTCALLRALYAYKRWPIEHSALAEQACTIEIERLHEPIGKQDQYIGAFGGVQMLLFSPDGISCRPVPMAPETRHSIEENLLLFFTGYSRRAGDVLSAARATDDDLDQVKLIAYHTLASLRQGDLAGFAAELNYQWAQKRRRQAGMTNPNIDAWYELGLANGALGGKLVGAGGGGFLLFYAQDRVQLRAAMARVELPEVHFRFDFEGTRIVSV